MIVPDCSSLGAQSRPHDWKYNQAERLENVVDRAMRGFESMLDEVCLKIWGGVVPPPGSAPKDEHPNVIVSFATPALLVGDDGNIILPIFTSEASAREFKGIPSHDGLDLVDVEPNNLVNDDDVFTFVFPGLHEQFAETKLSEAAEFVIVVDPTHPGTLRTSPYRSPFRDLLNAPDGEPISLLRAKLGVDRIFVWRRNPR